MSKSRSKTQPKPKPATPSVIEIVDEGLVPIRLKTTGQPDVELHVDLLLLRMACEKHEQQHHLEIKDEYYVPTAAFLTSLAKEFSEICGQRISETVAMQLWPHVNAKWYALKKNMNGTPS